MAPWPIPWSLEVLHPKQDPAVAEGRSSIEVMQTVAAVGLPHSNPANISLLGLYVFYSVVFALWHCRVDAGRSSGISLLVLRPRGRGLILGSLCLPHTCKSPANPFQGARRTRVPFAVFLRRKACSGPRFCMPASKEATLATISRPRA